MLSKAQQSMLDKAAKRDKVQPRGGGEFKTANSLVRKGLLMRVAHGSYFITDKGRKYVSNDDA